VRICSRDPSNAVAAAVWYRMLLWRCTGGCTLECPFAELNALRAVHAASRRAWHGAGWDARNLLANTEVT